MKHFGDITKIDGHKVPLVDVVCGGSPCQDLSVAGKRAGLAGERSGLFMEQIRIIKEMRDESAKQLCMRGATINRRCIQPRFMVWENVPGAFSSNGGEDFRAVIEETAKIICEDAVIPGPPGGRWTQSGCVMGEGWSIAWRVHDAQFWGVPQRRKRISLVADFGGESAPEILFERKSVSRDSAESADKGQAAPETVGGGSDSTISFQERAGKPGGGKGILIQNERTGALSTLNNQSVLAQGFDAKNVMETGGASKTLLAGQNDTHSVPTVFGISGFESNVMKSPNPHSGIYEAATSRTLDLNGGSPACNQGGMIVLEGNGQRESHQGDGYRESETMYTLNTVEQHAVCSGPIYSMGHDVRSAKFTDDEITDPLTATDYKDPIKVSTYGAQNPSAHAVCVSQDAYDKYSLTDHAATIKQSGGVYGVGGSEALVIQ